jgi:hypothetical protein
LNRDDELCERLIARGLATLLMEMYERPDLPLEPDLDGSRSLLRLSCWITGHSGEFLPILVRPGSSLKVGKLIHGDVVEVSDKLHYKVIEENDYSKIPVHLRPPQEVALPHYRLSDGRGFLQKESADHFFAAVFNVSSTTKEVIRSILKTLMGYDKYDPADPVNNQIVEISTAKGSPDQRTSSSSGASPNGQRASTAPSGSSTTLEFSPLLQVE